MLNVQSQLMLRIFARKARASFREGLKTAVPVALLAGAGGMVVMVVLRGLEYFFPPDPHLSPAVAASRLAWAMGFWGLGMLLALLAMTIKSNRTTPFQYVRAPVFFLETRLASLCGSLVGPDLEILKTALLLWTAPLVLPVSVFRGLFFVTRRLFALPAFFRELNGKTRVWWRSRGEELTRTHTEEFAALEQKYLQKTARATPKPATPRRL
jgi:hypothetical protein